MKKAGEKTDRISVLKKTRTPKGGGPLNPDTVDVIVRDKCFLLILVHH